MRLASLGQRLRSGASGLTIAVLAIALVGTVFGVGALGRADEVSDGNAWLWTSPTGEVSRVNGHNAQVDLVSSLPEAEGHNVEVTQNDQYLILHDKDTGKMTSVDLSEMGFTGSLDLGKDSDVGLALGRSAAVVIDRAAGEVRAVDPATLQPTGASINLPAPLVGGAFDDGETLWLGVPTQGTVAGVRVAGQKAEVAETVAVSDPGTDMALTVLDQGALAVDRADDRIVSIDGGGTPRVLDASASTKGAELPARTRGDMAAITAPSAGEIVTVSRPNGAGAIDSFSYNADGSGTAMPYAGRVYVPFDGDSLVRVYRPDGVEEGEVHLPEAKGPLGLEVREGSMFINAAESGAAAVVDPEGEARVIDKTARPPGPGGSPEPLPDLSTRQPEEPDHDGDDEPEERSADAPGAPTPVSFTAGDGSVTLSWPAAYSPDTPIESYEITWQGGSKTVSGDDRSVEITGLDNGTTYRFRVAATNENGTGPAAQTGRVTPSTGAPDAPEWVTAEAATSTSATVTWADVDGAEDYLVSTSAESGAGVTDRSSSTNSVTVTGLEPGGTYTFTVTPRGAGGVSGEAVSSDSLTLSETELSAPAKAEFTVNGGTVNVTWSEVEGAVKYRITPGGDGASAMKETTTAGATTSQSLNRGASGRCYSFTVTAIGPDGAAANKSTTSASSCVQEFR
ncbi:fibronectin type III domain-containing protein [Nocardiopsis gilva]|nr:fibronectin type III domain-containing protein [Nocardiopsis gilva]